MEFYGTQLFDFPVSVKALDGSTFGIAQTELLDADKKMILTLQRQSLFILSFSIKFFYLKKNLRTQ